MRRFDCVVIGGGPAGLTAGIYLGRARVNFVIFDEKGFGGLSVYSDRIENYPGFPDGLSGFELAQLMKKQAEKFGAKIEIKKVHKIQKKADFKVFAGEEVVEAKSIILAVGSNFKKLNIPGEKEFTGRGVSYCATCDGAFFNGKKVCVIGGGDGAFSEALFLTKFAEKVFIIHRRDEFRASKILVERAKQNPKVEFVLSFVPVEIQGEDKVKQIILKSTKTNEKNFLSCDGVFIAVGESPNTEFLKGFVDMDERGFIITDEKLSTSQKGVFAAGDCRAKEFRQIITACGDGAVSAFSCQEYLEKV
ncbi:MAG: thioredoxin-disulfide reductase [Elusimicrobia bacterium]|nr:thioredoxin-disulfide reductase [Elusimicrobiota bacterium]